MTRRPSQSRRLVVAGLVVAGLVVAVIGAAVTGVLMVRHHRRQSPLQASLAVVDDDGRFTTALEASDAFAEIGSRLTSVECDGATKDEACTRLRRAGAWAEVTAVLVAQCPPADVFT